MEKWRYGGFVHIHWDPYVMGRRGSWRIGIADDFAREKPAKYPMGYPYQFRTPEDAIVYIDSHPKIMDREVTRVVADNFWNPILVLLSKLPQPGRARVRRPYGEIGDVAIVFVDGNKVKTEIDMDFTEGANDLARSYVPAGQVWVDFNVGDEWPYIVLHELVERWWMNVGDAYEKAHKKANEAEKDRRLKEGG